jgi:hypothetical protein
LEKTWLHEKRYFWTLRLVTWPHHLLVARTKICQCRRLLLRLQNLLQVLAKATWLCQTFQRKQKLV